MKPEKEDGVWAVIRHSRGGSFSLLLIVIVVSLFAELVYWVYGLVTK